MTEDEYNELKVGDKVKLTEESRQWYGKNIHEWNSVEGKILKGDTGIVKCAKLVADSYKHIEIVELIRDVGYSPGIRGEILFDDKTKDTIILGHEEIYSPTRSSSLGKLIYESD